MKCVVLCAGAGRRLGANVPKPLVQINNKTVLQTVMEGWRSCVDGFVIVANPQWTEHFYEVLQTFETLPFIVVQQTQPKGIADAILPAQDWVGDKFVVVLGDCVCKGEWETHLTGHIKSGVGYWKQADIASIKAGYGFEVDGFNRITRLWEKPKRAEGLLCGMGVYFFDQDVFRYIQNAKPSPLRNEVEITDVLQSMVEGGLPLKAVPFNGQYININNKKDLEKAGEL